MKPVRRFEDLPPAFKVDLFAEMMGISRKIAYEVVKKEGLAIRVNEKRLVVLRDRVISWLTRK